MTRGFPSVVNTARQTVEHAMLPGGGGAAPGSGGRRSIQRGGLHPTGGAGGEGIALPGPAGHTRGALLSAERRSEEVVGLSAAGAPRAKGLTSRDVAREAGVSQNTVSLVLHGSPRVREETRQRVMAAMQRLGYRPNAMAAALRSHATPALLFVVSAAAVHHPVTAELLAGAIEGAAASGYALLVDAVDEDRPESAVDIYRARWVSGALVFAQAVDDPCVGALAAAGCPVVTLLQPHAGLPPGYAVVADDAGGAQAAVAHLLQRGHRQLGLVAAPCAGKVYGERILGARRAAEVGGASLLEVEASDWTLEAGRVAAAALLRCRPRPTAVFAISDRLAFGVLAAAEEAGLRVPREIAVVGFDNVEWTQYSRPPLTTVEFPMREIAVRGVERLLAEGQPPTAEKVPARLVLRQSS